MVTTTWLVAAAAAAASLVAAVPWADAAQQTGSEWRTVLTTKDIDGDGRDDVVRLRRTGDTRCAVRVRTATGEVATRVITRDPNPCDWHGAAPVDAVRGADISVVTSQGAHTAFHTLLTWRDGGLVVLPSPDGARDWVVDGAASSAVGVGRRVTAGGPRVILFRAFLDDSGSTFSGTSARYAYRHGAWVELGERQVTVSQRRAFRQSGWHVGGLPEWA